MTSLSEFGIRLLEHVGPYLDNREVITYGGSLGAWCAFYYGGAINAKIIGFSPLNPGHPDFSHGFAPSEFPYCHKNLSDHPISSKQPVVVIDPNYGADLEFLSRFIIPFYPNTYVYYVPFGGHNILDRMRRAGTLKDFVSRLLEGETPATLDILTEGCPLWHLEKAKNLRKICDYDGVERELRAALAAKRDKITVTNFLNFMFKFRSPEALQKELRELGIHEDQSELATAVVKQMTEAGILIRNY